MVIKMIHLNFHANFASEIHGWVLHDDRNQEFCTCGAGFNWGNGFSKLLRKPIVQKPKKNTIIWFISNLKLKYQSNYKQENSLQVWIKISTIQKQMRLKDKCFECSSEVLIVPFSKQGHRWRIFSTLRLMFLRNYYLTPSLVSQWKTFRLW